MDGDVSASDASLTDSDACAAAISAGEGSSTTSCEVSYMVWFTIEEKSGSCKATNVKVKWTFTFNDGSTQVETVDYGDVEAGDSEIQTLSITFANANNVGNVDADADASFGSDCGGYITGLGGSPL